MSKYIIINNGNDEIAKQVYYEIIGILNGKELEVISSRDIEKTELGTEDNIYVITDSYKKFMSDHPEIAQKKIVSLIDADVDMPYSYKLGANIRISKGVDISMDIQLGDNVSIGAHTNVAHDVKIGNDSTIGCHVSIGGECELGANVNIKDGAIIKEGIKIGEGATVEVGAVVLRDIEAYTKVMGNPARVIH